MEVPGRNGEHEYCGGDTRKLYALYQSEGRLNVKRSISHPRLRGRTTSAAITSHIRPSIRNTLNTATPSANVLLVGQNTETVRPVSKHQTIAFSEIRTTRPFLPFPQIGSVHRHASHWSSTYQPHHPERNLHPSSTPHGGPNCVAHIFCAALPRAFPKSASCVS